MDPRESIASWVLLLQMDKTEEEEVELQILVQVSIAQNLYLKQNRKDWGHVTFKI